jgi:hypothetical protein
VRTDSASEFAQTNNNIDFLGLDRLFLTSMRNYAGRINNPEFNKYYNEFIADARFSFSLALEDYVKNQKSKFDIENFIIAVPYLNNEDPESEKYFSDGSDFHTFNCIPSCPECQFDLLNTKSMMDLQWIIFYFFSENDKKVMDDYIKILKSIHRFSKNIDKAPAYLKGYLEANNNPDYYHLIIRNIMEVKKCSFSILRLDNFISDLDSFSRVYTSKKYVKSMCKFDAEIVYSKYLHSICEKMMCLTTELSDCAFVRDSDFVPMYYCCVLKRDIVDIPELSDYFDKYRDVKCYVPDILHDSPVFLDNDTDDPLTDPSIISSPAILIDRDTINIFSKILKHHPLSDTDSLFASILLKADIS